MDGWKAKNYLTSEVLDDLNRIVMIFLNHSEVMAKHNCFKTMSDWIKLLGEDNDRYKEAQKVSNNEYNEIYQQWKDGKITKERLDKKVDDLLVIRYSIFAVS